MYVPLAMLLTTLMFSACNNGGQFKSGDKDKGEKQGSERDGGSSDSEGADDPVMVGAAYLACVEIEAPDPNSKDIACALNNAATGAKIPLSSGNLNWSVTENGVPVDVDNSAAAPQAPYHQLFSFLGPSYSKQSIGVVVNGAGGQSQRYGKALSRLDQNLRTTAASSNGLALTELTQVAEFYPRESNNSNTCSDALNCAVAIAGKAYMKHLKVCNEGNINSVAISQRFSTANLQSTIKGFKFDDAEMCIYNAQISIEESGGCYLVPVLWKQLGRIKYHVIHKQGSGLSLYGLQVLAAAHSCSN